jgi:putative hemolysin
LQLERKKNKGNPGEGIPAASESLVAAKSAYNKAKQAVDAAKLAAVTEGVKAFELYENPLSDEARQPWEKIVQAQMTKCLWEDIYGVTHDETPTKTWDSFMECVTFHLQQVFRYDAGEALKYYIMNTLRKPKRIPIRQFLVQVEQLNSYLETLLCLYYSPSANQATKQVLPLDDANLVTHLLRMRPAKWQTQYDLTDITAPVNTRALLLILEKIENNAVVGTKPPSMTKPKGAGGKCRLESIDSRIPKKSKQVGFSNKQCTLCKKHGGPHKSQNTRDCCKYNPDGTPIKRNGGAARAQRNGHADKNRSNQRR